MNNKEVDRINKLTFRGLKNELAKCNNPLKEKIIRNLMLFKYKQHLEKRRQEEMYQRLEQKEESNECPFNDDDFEKPNFGSLNELDERSKDVNYANREIKEQGRDRVNKSIIDRLNNDIDIKEMRNNKKKPPVVSPYTNIAGDNFAPYHSKQSTERGKRLYD